jgi:hypothetical protein
MEASAYAPADAKPLRIAVCTSLPEVISDPVHDGIGIEWFADAEHLDRFESWLAGAGGDSVLASLDAAIDVGASPVVVARQLVLRGADWLENRWRSGGARLKHMAIARRAAELSPEEFSERWKGRAGSLKSADTGSVVEIPAKARGHAYLQNHPLATPGGGWAYDALNEVYFDELADLRVRIAWFEQNLGDHAEEDLVSESWFIAAREDVLLES